MQEEPGPVQSLGSHTIKPLATPVQGIDKNVVITGQVSAILKDHRHPVGPVRPFCVETSLLCLICPSWFSLVGLVDQGN